jgi:hypothetical protein
MNKTATTAAALLLLSLGACGGKTASDQAADNLQAAADQSDPAAAEVLDNAADAIRDNESSPADANATAQDALSEAGNAQANSQ